ncbi:MAG: hypothetical protein LBE75_07080 [Burkholderiales bacterium]|jgi:hypothetical protein|nr:hypothetical protein [Burkholderiales bacterium]
MSIKRILICFIFLPVVVAVLTGCQTLDTKYAEKDAGTVALSLATERQTSLVSSYSLLIRSRDDPDKTASLAIHLSLNPMKLYEESDCEHQNHYHSHFVSPEEINIEDVEQVFSLNMKAGGYEIYGFNAFTHNPLRTYRYTFSNKKPFSIPFDVKENETIYIGSYRLTFLANHQGFFSKAPVSVPSELLVSDYFERDIDAIKTHFQKENISAKNLMPTEEKTGGEFIRFIKKE